MKQRVQKLIAKFGYQLQGTHPFRTLNDEEFRPFGVDL
jgi:hypothetical protein